MNKVAIYIILIALILSLTACGAKQKMEEKITEKIVETAVGGDVDIDGEEVTIKGENGEEVTVGGTDWPSSDIADKLPEFKKGEITSAVSAEGYLLIIVEKVDDQDFIDYYKDILKNYTINSNISKSYNGLTYMGSDKEGTLISLVYNADEKTLNISGGKAELSVEEESDIADSDVSYLSDVQFGDLNWSTPEFAKKLPEFKDGKIESISSFKNNVTIVLNSVDEKSFESYSGNIKKDFINDSFDIKNEETASYYGGDDSGFNITLTYNYKDKILSISASQ